MIESTKKYAFVLGREQEICLEELKSVLARFCFCFSASARQRRDWDIFRISGNVVFAKMTGVNDDGICDLINTLAGTVKIFELVDSLGNDIPVQLTKLLSDRKADNRHPEPAPPCHPEPAPPCHPERSEGSSISKPEIPRQDPDPSTSLGTTSSARDEFPGRKFNFGVSCFNKNITRQQINSFALTAKKKLKGRYSLRYVESRDSAELSSILTLKNNLLGKGIEFGIFDEEIGILVALNNPEEWNKRDYGKPASDKFSGMLPPKLARMLVNLALGQASLKQNVILNEVKNLDPSAVPQDDEVKLNSSKVLVVDCFCGSGNILLEAMMLGCDVIGSDISPKAVSDSEQNCKWLVEQIKKSSVSARPSLDGNIKNKNDNVKLKNFQADATSPSYIEVLNSKFNILNSGYKNYVFVTEPYLGEPKKYKPSRSAVIGEYTKVKELYLKFLENIAQLLNCSIVKEQGSVPETNNNRTIEQLNNCTLCLVFPLVETMDSGRYSLFSDCVDQIKKMGYTQTRSTFVYGREYQVVKREIVSLKLT